MASDLAIVFGLTGRQTSWPAAKAVATGEQPSAWAPFMRGSSPSIRPSSVHSSKALGDLREQRPRGDGHDAAVGQLPAELLGDLEGQRLRALGVVGAQVDVHERPVALGAQLGAQPVDVVVVALDADQPGPVDASGEDLLLLEVGGDEDVGVHARARPRGRPPSWPGCRSRRRRSSGSRARGARVTATETTRSLKEWVGLAASFLTQTSRRPSRCGEPVGADQRRAAGGQAHARGRAGQRGPGGRRRAAGSRRSARCSAGRPGCGGAVRRCRSAGARVVVDDLERPEALLADVLRLQRVLSLALPALKMTHSHWGPFRSLPSPVTGVAKSPRPATHLSGIGTFPL